jgi:hypothetical protein
MLSFFQARKWRIKWFTGSPGKFFSAYDPHYRARVVEFSQSPSGDGEIVTINFPPALKANLVARMRKWALGKG